MRFHWMVALTFAGAGLAGPADYAMAQGGDAGTDGAASSPSIASQDRIGVHVVRPGDTLIGLSQRLSGGAERWRDNWRLNPEIKNPDFLPPGTRLRLYLTDPVPLDVARVTKVSRDVDTRPLPNPWLGARRDDLLAERDGVRTRQQSSAEVVLADGNSLQITENSLVFLRRVGSTLRGVTRDEIELVEGQAELAGRETGGSGSDREIEFVVGSTRAKPQPSAEGVLQTRARRAAAGGAQVMMYEGEAAVESGGETVEVARGMGTTVAEGAPPAPPEKLLDAPNVEKPASGASLAVANPILGWREVDGADSYTVELCADVECGVLLRRRQEITTASFRPEGLTPGDYHWRVTAVAPSGLDGYPSATRPLTLTEAVADFEAPAVELRVDGPMVAYAGNLILGATAGLNAVGEDRETSIAGWTWLLDGREVDAEDWGGSWQPGAHEATFKAVDQAGNEASVEPLRFVSDPEAPELSSQVGGAELVSRLGNLDYRTPEPPSRGRAAELREHGVVLEWSADGSRWLPLWISGDRGGSGEVRGDLAQAFFRPAALRSGERLALRDGPDSELTPDEVLVFQARDAGSTVGALRFGLTPGNAGDLTLWVEAEDLVGNVRRTELGLGR